MARLEQLHEKTFIKQTLSRYATTAMAERFDDCITIDLSKILGVPGLPYLVYSMDHPSKISRPLPPGMEWRFYGRWIAGCTCGDVLAMGARPHGFSADLSAPIDTEVATIEQIYAGLSDVLAQYGAEFEGGNFDINTQLGVVGFCWGIVERNAIIRRVGAQNGDYVAVTSAPGIGWSSYLLNKRGLFTRLDKYHQRMLEEYNLMPTAPARAIIEAARLPGAITSGMDLTDGPIEFFYNIAERNGLGVRVEERLIPLPEILLAAAAALDVPAPLLALDPGYDTPRIHGYTIARERWNDVKSVFDANSMPLYQLGEVTSTSGVMWVPISGPPRELPRFWADQFREKQLLERWLDLVDELR